MLEFESSSVILQVRSTITFFFTVHRLNRTLANFLRNPIVSTMGRTTLIPVDAKTQRNEITTHAVCAVVRKAVKTTLEQTYKESFAEDVMRQKHWYGDLRGDLVTFSDMGGSTNQTYQEVHDESEDECSDTCSDEGSLELCWMLFEINVRFHVFICR